MILVNIMLVLAIIAGLFITSNYLYKKARYTHITAVFDEAEPFSPRMRVFYKGFRIGKVTKVEPNEDYTATYMRIALFPENVKIPDNVTVKIKPYKDAYNYVDIISPSVANTTFLKEGSKVKGSVSQNVNTFFSRQADEGTLEIVVQGVVSMLAGVNKTVADADELIAEMRTTFREASPHLVESSRNISTISTHFSGASLKISNTVNQPSLDRTMDNIERSSEYVESLTQKLNYSIKDLPETMDRVNTITKDVNGITSGVNRTLKKRFGVARLFFGTPVDSECRCRE